MADRGHLQAALDEVLDLIGSAEAAAAFAAASATSSIDELLKENDGAQTR